MTKKYDVVFIGAGPSGYSAAAILGLNGKKVAVVEKSSLGGVCVNEGCIPTKTLLKSAKLLNDIQDAKKYGLTVFDFKADYKVIQAVRKNVKNKLNDAIANTLKDSHVELYKGEAKVLTPNKIEVNNQILECDNLVLATGSSSRQINFVGLDKLIEEKKVYLTSKEFLVEENLPKSLLIYGGGPISLEFAYIASTFGVNVTIIEFAEKLLEKMDPIAGIEITKLLENKKIKVITNTAIDAYLGNNEYQYKSRDNKIGKIKCDKLFIAVGRVPNNQSFASLNLEKVGPGFVKVDANMKTSIDHIYAIGDITGSLMLTTTAYKHGDILVETLLNKKIENFSTKFVAWAIYLNPELAGVGMFESDAIKEYGKDNILTIMIPAAKLPKSHVESKTGFGFFKLVIEKTSGKILGSLILLENASLLINEIALAISLNATVKDLQAVGHTHPTFAEAIYYACRGLGIALR